MWKNAHSSVQVPELFLFVFLCMGWHPDIWRMCVQLWPVRFGPAQMCRNSPDRAGPLYLGCFKRQAELERC